MPARPPACPLCGAPMSEHDDRPLVRAHAAALPLSCNRVGAHLRTASARLTQRSYSAHGSSMPAASSAMCAESSSMHREPLGAGDNGARRTARDAAARPSARRARTRAPRRAGCSRAAGAGWPTCRSSPGRGIARSTRPRLAGGRVHRRAPRRTATRTRRRSSPTGTELRRGDPHAWQALGSRSVVPISPSTASCAASRWAAHRFDPAAFAASATGSGHARPSADTHAAPRCGRHPLGPWQQATHGRPHRGRAARRDRLDPRPSDPGRPRFRGVPDVLLAQASAQAVHAVRSQAPARGRPAHLRRDVRRGPARRRVGRTDGAQEPHHRHGAARRRAVRRRPRRGRRSRGAVRARARSSTRSPSGRPPNASRQRSARAGRRTSTTTTGRMPGTCACANG